MKVWLVGLVFVHWGPSAPGGYSQARHRGHLVTSSPQIRSEALNTRPEKLPGVGKTQSGST
jgi:hypothetical protein